jgi:hypothetical protein
MVNIHFRLLPSTTDYTTVRETGCVVFATQPKIWLKYAHFGNARAMLLLKMPDFAAMRIAEKLT